MDHDSEKAVFSDTDPNLKSFTHPMTGYTVHTGSSQKFTQGWDQVFGGQSPKAKAVRPAATKAVVKPAKKSPKSK